LKPISRYSYWPYYQRREHCRPKNIGTYGWHRFTVWRRQKSRVPHFAFPKNRFGSTAEIGIYEMLGSGLREVSNLRRYWFRIKTKNCQGLPSLYPRRDETTHDWDPVIGQYSCLRNASTQHDGLQRQETEYDFSSSKRAGFRLGAKDVFLNITEA
jgi:hypothetical protein